MPPERRIPEYFPSSTGRSSDRGECCRDKDYANKMLTRFMAEEKNRKETEKREREQAEQKAARERHARECVTYEEYCRRNNIPTSGSLARDLERRI